MEWDFSLSDEMYVLFAARDVTEMVYVFMVFPSSAVTSIQRSNIDPSENLMTRSLPRPCLSVKIVNNWMNEIVFQL